jgi:hypothetical protein
MSMTYSISRMVPIEFVNSCIAQSNTNRIELPTIANKIAATMIVQETSSAVPSPDLFFQTTPPIKSDAAHDNNTNPVTFALDVTGYDSIVFH